MNREAKLDAIGRKNKIVYGKGFSVRILGSATQERRYLPFLIPALLVLSIILIYPLVSSFKMSFYSYYLPFPPPMFIGIQNFIDVFSTSLFWTALKNTFAYVIFTVSTELILGFSLALALNHERLRGRSIYLTFLLLPLVITPVVGGLMMKWMFIDKWGLVNYLLSVIGVKGPSWFASETYSMIAVVIADIWTYTPFVMLMLLAGLQSVPMEMLEAARVDGATKLGVFWHVILPWLKPVILLALVIRIMDAVRAFDNIFAMTQGGPGDATTTLPLYNYLETFQRLEVGKGAAVGVLTLVLLSFAIILLIRAVYFTEKGEW